MKAQVDDSIRAERESVSVLMDGELAAFPDCAVSAANADQRDSWAVYHLIGDVLRAPSLAVSGAGEGFATQVMGRIAREGERPSLSVVETGDAVMGAAAGAAANDDVFRWKMVAGLASVSAVTVLGWTLWAGVGTTHDAGAQFAQRGDSPFETFLTRSDAQQPPSARSAELSNGVLRDPRLDELMAVHRQTAGASSLGGAGGFLRNATFESPSR